VLHPGVVIAFDELGVAPELVAAHAKQGITEPTAIQRLALPVLLAGGDAYLNSETGTGKTLAYLLPFFARLELDAAAAQAIVIAPTHELAIQIHRQSLELAQHTGWPVRSLLLLGGTSMERQLEKLKSKSHVVVGSPGRIRELIDIGKLKTQVVRTLVLDEVDRLLDSDGLPGIRAILRGLHTEPQLGCASATEQTASTSVLATLAPEMPTLRPSASATSAGIAHLYVVCEDRDKPFVLRQLLHATKPERALVFAHQNSTVERVAAHLAHHKLPVATLHSALDKFKRKQAMDDFRDGRAMVMLASDVAARGLDLPGVSHVFNLDVPTQCKAYLHRVGRTGRAGAKGTAISLMAESETRLVARYESELGITLTRVRVREGRLATVTEAAPRD
jgi:superfamily II DNA/RNA helicase